MLVVLMEILVQQLKYSLFVDAVSRQQADQCRKLSSSLQSQNPSHPLPVLIQVAQLCREKQHSRAIELLQVDVTSDRFSLIHIFKSTQPASVVDYGNRIKLLFVPTFLINVVVLSVCDTRHLKLISLKMVK